MSQESDELEILTFVATEPEASLIVTTLKSQSIDAVAEGALTSALRAEVPGEVRIVVRRGDLEQARQVLADFREGNSDLDWSKIDLGEPE